jgi:hypothetical protein
VTDQPCRHCLHWKRKTHTAGVCWHDEIEPHGQLVDEQFSCPQWTPKVIEVTCQNRASTTPTTK